jgi:aspartate/methionine/tyrosine aminotransferase
MINNSKRLEHISEYYFSKKLREVKALIDKGKDVVNLGIGSPDLLPPENSIKTLIKSLNQKNAHKYQGYSGIYQLREKISSFYKKYYNVDLHPDQNILPLIGSKEGIFHISMSFLNDDDSVLIPNPGYPSYSSITKLMGNKIINYDLIEANNWEPDFNKLNQLDLSKVKIMWVNYPNMPTGRSASINLFKKIVQFGKENNILIVNDNPYSFILNDNPLSIMSISGAMENCIELNSMSKIYNMAGWRVGFVVANHNFIKNILKVKSNIDSGMFYPVQMGAANALSQNNDWFEKLNMKYKERRELVWELTSKLDCTFCKENVGMFVWGKINKSISSKEFVDNLLQKFGIFVAPGIIFGTNGEGYIRISLCNSTANIKKAISRL